MRLFLLFATTPILWLGIAFAAPGDLDPTFAPLANDMVISTIEQPDGKILAVGDFTSVGGIAGHNRIMRLLPDGTLDSTFSPGLDIHSLATTVALQPDGAILVGGTFGSATGFDNVHFVARLFPDGSVDTNFNLSVKLSAAVLAIAVQTDGKILIGGNFLAFDGKGYDTPSLIRVLPDGTIDETFTPPYLNQNVNTIVPLPDGKLLVGGGFSEVGGPGGPNNLMRLNADGTLDESFVPPVLNRHVISIAVQADGKILAGGFFTDAGGNENLDYLVRVGPDGALDDTFTPPSLNYIVLSLISQTDGKTMVSGYFTDADGRDEYDSLVRLLPDGSIDDTFVPPALNSFAFGSALLSTGEIVVGGNFTEVDGNSDLNYLIRLENDEATNHLSVSDSATLQWNREGASPEAATVTFEASTDGGANFILLGEGSRIPSGWQLKGGSAAAAAPGPGNKTASPFPPGTIIRARAYIPSGNNSASFGILEKLMTIRKATTSRPTIRIAGPRRIETTRNRLTIKGSASQLDGTIAYVRYLTNSPGQSDSGEARGTTNWAAKFRLRNGRNSFQFQAVNEEGDTSRKARVTVRKLRPSRARSGRNPRVAVRN